MFKITQFFCQKYFSSSVRKGESAVVALIYVKNDIKVLKILKCTFLKVKWLRNKSSIYFKLARGWTR